MISLIRHEELYVEYGIEKLSRSLEVLYEGVKVLGGNNIEVGNSH